MNNRTPENFRNLYENRSLDPGKGRQTSKEAGQETNQEKVDVSGSNTTNKASSLFDFNEVGVFVRKKHVKHKSIGSTHSWKNSNSHKSSALSTSKHSDESLEKTDGRVHSKHNSSDTSNKAGNDETGSQNASYHNLLIDFKPHHLQKKSADLTISRGSIDNSISTKPVVLLGNISNTQINPKQENDSGSAELKSKSDSNDSSEKSATPINQPREKRIPVPIASKMIKGDVIERIKNKVASTSNSNNLSFSFSNSFLAEFKKEKRSDALTREPEERKSDEEELDQNTKVIKNPIILNVNNQEVYADGTETDFSPKRTTGTSLGHFQVLRSKTDPYQSYKDNEEEEYMKESDYNYDAQNDVLKFLYSDRQSPRATPKWEQNPAISKSRVYESNFYLPGVLHEIPESSTQSNFGGSDIQSQSGSHRSGETSQISQGESLAQKYASPQSQRTPGRKILSALSTECTYDGDFLLNHDSFTTHFSGNSKKNSEKLEFHTPSKDELDPRFQDREPEYQARMFPIPKSSTPLSQTEKYSKSRIMPTTGANLNTVVTGSDNSDRSSLNEEFNIQSNFSTPQLQGHQPISFQPGLSQKNIMESLISTSPVYPMNQPYPMTQMPQNLNIMNLFQGLGIQNPGIINYSTEPSGMQMKPPGKNSKRIPDDEQNAELYEIDLERVHENPKTTIMIKNIPNKYNRDSMMQDINKNHQGTFDFFYLPIDFKNRCNVGYAFINFIDSRYIKNFFLEFNGKKWGRFKSEKICKIKYARLQGLKTLKQHFRSSIVMNQQDPNLRPWILEDELMMAQQQQQIDANPLRQMFAVERPVFEGLVKQQGCLLRLAYRTPSSWTS